jgi:hypothetical protein
MITEADLRDNLSILASDAMEGRETGKRGQKMAAAFIKTHYEELGLLPPVNGSYYQPVELFTSGQGEVYIKFGENRFKNFEEIVFYGTDDTRGEITVSTVFAGRGKPEDLEQIDVKDKGAVVVLNSEDSFRPAYEALKEKGAKKVFYFYSNNEEYVELARQFKAFYGTTTLSLTKPDGSTEVDEGVFFISSAVAEKMFNTNLQALVSSTADKNQQALKKFKPVNITYRTTQEVKAVKTENVLGYLEGTDKKDELIIITSHYDHIGKKSSGTGDLINNGADDDGSGTVAVMQLAKVFAQAKKDGKGPRRSILFMNVTGEEKGLLGSDYYTQNPVFPLVKTVVNLNIDMVGRSDPKYRDGADYVYVIGSDKLSMELHNLNESINKTYNKLVFDYVYNDQSHPERLYYRSDHWNFAKNNIPIIFYFDGIHEDYHLPSDEIEKIEFDLLTKRTQHVFYTAWEIANREKKISPDLGEKK